MTKANRPAAPMRLAHVAVWVIGACLIGVTVTSSAPCAGAMPSTPAIRQQDTSLQAASAKKKTATRKKTTRSTTNSNKASTSRDTTQTAPRGMSAAGGDKLTVTPAEYNGWKVFAVNCTRCHGEDAIGSALAPSLVKSLQGTVTHDVFVQTVKEGRPAKGMPSWGPLLTDKQVEDLYAYLKARSEGRLATGRPHVRQGN
jgi:mono/diheme cytochrome c family protein